MKQQKTDRRSQRTYHLVSSAFTELLREKPYDEILVQDILDRAGIDMPYPPEQMETIFQKLALPGVWAMLEQKAAFLVLLDEGSTGEQL